MLDNNYKYSVVMSAFHVQDLSFLNNISDFLNTGKERKVVFIIVSTFYNYRPADPNIGDVACMPS